MNNGLTRARAGVTDRCFAAGTGSPTGDPGTFHHYSALRAKPIDPGQLGIERILAETGPAVKLARLVLNGRYAGPSPASSEEPIVQTYQANVFARPDTLLGVCQAIGEDFRFNANWLRVAFALPMFFAPVMTIVVYLTLGLVVMATRLAVPNPRVQDAAHAEASEPAAPARVIASVAVRQPALAA